MFFFLLLLIQPVLLSLRRGQASVSYAQSLVGAPETRLTALDNGFRVASEDTGHATCTVSTHLHPQPLMWLLLMISSQLY